MSGRRCTVETYIHKLRKTTRIGEFFFKPLMMTSTSMFKLAVHEKFNVTAKCLYAPVDFPQGLKPENIMVRRVDKSLTGMDNLGLDPTETDRFWTESDRT